ARAAQPRRSLRVCSFRAAAAPSAGSPSSTRINERCLMRMIGLAALSVILTSVGAAQEPPVNTLTAKEKADGWRLLFDGKTTDGWRGYRQKAMPAGWQVVDGALTRVSQASDIVTIDEFGDFELTLEWKVPPNGNSGVHYRVVEEDDV